MTRSEAIAIITDKLAALDDAGVLTVADIVQDLANPDDDVRELTPRELALIDQSKDDFKSGRTYSLDEARAHSDALLKTLRAKYPTAP